MKSMAGKLLEKYKRICKSHRNFNEAFDNVEVEYAIRYRIINDDDWRHVVECGIIRDRGFDSDRINSEKYFNQFERYSEKESGDNFVHFINVENFNGCEMRKDYPVFMMYMPEGDEEDLNTAIYEVFVLNVTENGKPVDKFKFAQDVCNQTNLDIMK